MSMRRTLATLYGVGLCGFAPGTAGSAVAALLAYGILLVPFGWALLPLAAALFTFLGTKSATRYMHDQGTAHDPGEIIVDELAGQWFTYSIWHLLLIWVDDAGSRMDTICHEPLFMAAGFFLFRLFDILKPWPISWVDKNIHGGFGVMFDDLLAAIPAGICLYGFYTHADYFLGMLGLAA